MDMKIVMSPIATQRTAEVCDWALPAIERTAICEKDGDTASALLLRAAERRIEENIMVKVQVYYGVRIAKKPSVLQRVLYD